MGTTTVRDKLGTALHTCFAFWVAVYSLPVLAVSFVAVRVTKHFWLKLLSSRYPHLEFVRTDTIRSLLDTHRNQGIINVLLCVKGPWDTELIKERLLQHVVDKRDKMQALAFPRMRAALVSCWGNYAWDNNQPFRIENHFIVSSGVFRGRPITDLNIQEYVSEIVSKYFPTDQSPWQFIVVPCLSPDNKYYVLVRVHHLLLTGKKSINIGDLLLIEQSTEAERINTPTVGRKMSPLAQLFPAPSAIPELYSKIGESCSNTWNEFVSEYDPVESPRALKSRPGAFHCAGLALIITLTALREVNKRRVSGGARDAASTLRHLVAALRNECRRREFGVEKLLLSPLVTMDPRKWPPRLLRFTVEFAKLAATWPLTLRQEIVALKALKTPGQPVDPATLAWRWSELGRLAWRAAAEAWRGAAAALRAPAQLWEDAVRADAGRTHALQTASLCGRKVTAWSRGVSRSGVERVATALGVSDTDVMLYAAGEALRAYFDDARQAVPASVLTTARTATQDFLYAFSEGDGKHYKKSQTGGMVCVSLPLGAGPARLSGVLSRACHRQAALASAWAAQARCGALTRALPSPAARLALNALSRRYAVSYAEISAPPGSRARSTAWGHQLDHVVYWRPPQANISMSLTVIQYADTVRLAVMTDARLSPHHAAAAARWPHAIDELIRRVEQEEAASEACRSHASNIVQHSRINQKPIHIAKRIIYKPQTNEDDAISRDVVDSPSSSKLKKSLTDPSYNIQAKASFGRSESDVGRKVSDVEGTSQATAMLRPPPIQAVSPPPMRRKIAKE